MPRGFQSPLGLMAPCRITQRSLDRSSTVAGLLAELVHLVCLVDLVCFVIWLVLFNHTNETSQITSSSPN